MAASGSSEAYKRVVGGKLNLKGGLSLKPDAAGVKKKKKKKAKVDKDADGKELVVAAEGSEEAKGKVVARSKTHHGPGMGHNQRGRLWTYRSSEAHRSELQRRSASSLWQHRARRLHVRRNPKRWGAENVPLCRYVRAEAWESHTGGQHGACGRRGGYL
jgi:hypothetical protein